MLPQIVQGNVPKAVQMTPLILPRRADVQQRRTAIARQVLNIIPMELPHFPALQILDHKTGHIDRVFGRRIGWCIGKVKLRQFQSCHFCANGRCQYINALVHTVAANDLRTQQPQAFLFIQYLHYHRLCAGVIGSVGCREKHDFVVSNPCCPRCLFIDSRKGRCQAKQFQNRRALRAVIAAASAADIVSGNSSLLVGRPRQRDQCFLAGHEMADLYGIAHSIDVRRGGFHPLVDSDAATNTKFESGFFCQMRIRGNTDGQQHHIRMQRLTTLQQSQHGISVLSESGDGFTQPQSHAVSAHFRMDKARHIRIQR